MTQLIRLHVLVLSLLACAPANGCTTANPPSASPSGGVSRAAEVSITVETNNGSRIVATAGPQTITFHSLSAGKVTVPLTALKSVTRYYGWQNYEFTLRNGEVLRGVPEPQDLQMSGPSGQVRIGFFNLTRVTIDDPPLAAFPITFADPGEVFEWGGFHNTDGAGIVDGALTFDITGLGYLHRANLKIPAYSCPSLVVRMKTDIATRGLLYWMTDTQLGFVVPSFVAFKITPDGQYHDITIPVGTNPFWRGTITAVRIDCDPQSHEKGYVAIESIAALPAPQEPVETVKSPYGWPVFDGKPSRPMPEWVRDTTVATDYMHTTEPGFGYFFIRDKNSSMKWYREFPRPVDPKVYSEIEIEYQAWETVDDGDAYVLWLFDNRPGNYAGFAAIKPKDIVADGETHSLRIPLAQFDPAGPITGCAIRVRSGPLGWGFVFIHRLRFLSDSPVEAAAALAAQSAANVTRFRGDFRMNEAIPVNLACASFSGPGAGGATPLHVLSALFREDKGFLHCLARMDEHNDATAAFAVRVRLFDRRDAALPIAVREKHFSTVLSYMDISAHEEAQGDFDFGPSQDYPSVAAFDVEIENLPSEAGGKK